MEYNRNPDEVRQQTQYKIDYQQRCFNVPRQICDSNSCTSQGCVDGGSVCSSNDYTYQQRCATLVGSPMGTPGQCGTRMMPGAESGCSGSNGNV